jgi:hypothetical protein
MKHAELVKRAHRWLANTQGCSVVLSELTAFTTTGETPDALGFRPSYGVSILVECKTSKADFRADAKKAFRISGVSGMGDYRFYMCEPGVLSHIDMPAGWGLLYVHEKRVTLEFGANPRKSEPAPFTGHKKNELIMCVSALRRVGAKAVDEACKRKDKSND